MCALWHPPNRGTPLSCSFSERSPLAWPPPFPLLSRSLPCWLLLEALLRISPQTVPPGFKRRQETQDHERKFGRQMIFIGRRELRGTLETPEAALFGPKDSMSPLHVLCRTGVLAAWRSPGAPHSLQEVTICSTQAQNLPFHSLTLTMPKRFYVKRAISKDFMGLESVNQKILGAGYSNLIPD